MSWAVLGYVQLAVAQTPPATGQTAPEDTAPAAGAAVESSEKVEIPATSTTIAPEISIDLLETRLRPLTLEEVQVELDAWLALLKSKAIEFSEATVEGASLSGEALSRHQLKILDLRGDRANLADRTRIVVAEVEAKGGDATTAKLYIANVSATLRPTGFASTVALVQAWMVSSDGGVRFGLNVAKFFGCVIAGWIIGSVFAGTFEKSLRKIGKSSTLLRSFLVKTIRRVAVFVGIIIGLSYLGVNIGPVLAAIGAAGLVIGLALQGTLSNFASGLLILFYRPFDVGDMVTAGGITGKVQSMTLVNTVFNTPDNQVVIVPNSKIWDDVITNVTASPNRRIDLIIGIGYGDDIDQAKAVLHDIVEKNQRVLDDPPVQIGVGELGDSSVDLVVRPWCRNSDYWDLRFELIQSIKQRFDAEGISFPFPQRDVHLFKTGPSKENS